MLVIVTYDVCLDVPAGKKRLRRVAKCCTNYGIRVQNSVFECIVDQAQFLRMRHDILKEIDESKDSVRFYFLGDKYSGKVEHIGAKQTIHVEEPLFL
ncbi:MAG: CRISPR-associated endonuclease Cas2 [Clostridiales bacterium]|nr:CRISPR-associated endonuclease Cas2 [Clostridiales bacterium]